VNNNSSGYYPSDGKIMPDDWSYIQIGTTGEFKSRPFQVAGRIRLQLRNEYKNFWCAADHRGDPIWIAESFGSMSVFTSPWQKFPEKVAKLRAGVTIHVSQSLKLVGESVEKCESLSIRGEIAEWILLNPGFFILQAGISSITAYFFPEDENNIHMLLGEKATIESLKLKNILQWNEWK
jgi:hypothetical protein